MATERVDTYRLQRQALTDRCRALASLARGLDGHAARSCPLDRMADLLESCALGEIRRHGDRIERLIEMTAATIEHQVARETRQ